jgi:hypothetical protein
MLLVEITPRFEAQRLSRERPLKASLPKRASPKKTISRKTSKFRPLQ